MDRVDLLHWREVTLFTRVHQNLIAAGAGSIQIGAIAQSWTSEEPDRTFLGTEFMQASFTSTLGAPGLLSNALVMRGGLATAACMTAMARIIARGSRAAAGVLAAQITVEFSVKDA